MATRPASANDSSSSWGRDPSTTTTAATTHTTTTNNNTGIHTLYTTPAVQPPSGEQRQPQQTITTTTITIPLHQRMATLLTAVNNLLLVSSSDTTPGVSSCASSSSSVSSGAPPAPVFSSSGGEWEAAMLERIRYQHAQDFHTAEQSGVDVEHPTTERQQPQQDQPELLSEVPFETLYRHPPPHHPSSSSSLRRLAIRSTAPVLTMETVQALRNAAEEIWDRQQEQPTTTTTTASKFTYQYAGNFEAHVFDFNSRQEQNTSTTTASSSWGIQAITALNAALHTTVYPLIRDAFFSQQQQQTYHHSNSGEDPNTNNQNDHNNQKQKQNHRDVTRSDDDDVALDNDGTTMANSATTRLFVYDALVIRYNATAAAATAATRTNNSTTVPSSVSAAMSASAGQPLHRDLGLISVNIMLNSDEDFVGGGTFFEQQLAEQGRPTNGNGNEATEENAAAAVAGVVPLRPKGVGYCLAHSASERHAGAGTTKGVRDILVLFVSAVILPQQHQVSSSRSSSPYTTEGLSSASSVSRSSYHPDGDNNSGIPIHQDEKQGNDYTDPRRIIPPGEILSLRLKSCRDFCNGKYAQQPTEALLCRILHQKLAVECSFSSSSSLSLHYDHDLHNKEAPFLDGEAVQYLGTALMEYADHLYQQHDLLPRHYQMLKENTGDDNNLDDKIKRSFQSVLELYHIALECMQIAKVVTPCDSRVYNNVGIILGKINDMVLSLHQPGVVDTTEEEERAKILETNVRDQEEAYRYGLELLMRSREAGCSAIHLQKDLDILRLNYGLLVANQDRFHEAASILAPMIATTATSRDSINNNNTDAFRLWKFCNDKSN